MEIEALRLLIRSKLNDGRLPYDSMPRFWGGAGDGEQCDVCDTLITKEQLVSDGGYCLGIHQQEACSISRQVLLRLGCREARAAVVAFHA
jgi:hypothetical protein